MEASELFFLRADRDRDTVADYVKLQSKGKVAITTYLKTGDSSAHVELDAKGPYRDLCTALIAAVTKVHELGGEASPPMAPRSLTQAIEVATPRAIEETVED